MDDGRIVRRVKPMLAISTTLTIKTWVEDEARRKGTSQADIVNTLIKREMLRSLAAEIEADAELAEMAVAS